MPRGGGGAAECEVATNAESSVNSKSSCSGRGEGVFGQMCGVVRAAIRFTSSVVGSRTAKAPNPTRVPCDKRVVCSNHEPTCY